MQLPSTDDVAWYYRSFADREAHGRSAVYVEWAEGVAADEEVCALIGTLPRAKRQANLVFAAARWCGAAPGPYHGLRELLLDRWREIAGVIAIRSTQTNEAARCATLLPELARIDGPIALLEVGASAGLCLYPDRYGYRYQTPDGVAEINTAGQPGVVIDAAARDVDLPARVPDVAWRRGIDLNPIDIAEEDTLDWLETLIWPEHEQRRRRLRAAARLVAADPPRIIAGDLVAELPAVAAEAPDDTTLVVFHSAVLAYLDPAERQRFVDEVSALDAVWLSNEGGAILPEVAGRLPAGTDPGSDFILARDGRPVAFTGPHGQHVTGLRSAL